jgi:hypothetical protein
MSHRFERSVFGQVFIMAISRGPVRSVSGPGNNTGISRGFGMSVFGCGNITSISRDLRSVFGLGGIIRRKTSTNKIYKQGLQEITFPSMIN